MLAVSCATREAPRPRPLQILDCPEVANKIIERDRFFVAIRGSATVKGPQMSFDADVAARSPSDLRVEVSGPLGVKIGLLVMNQDWVRFVVPREELILRIPKSELDKKTLRAEKFLSAIVVPLPPDLLVSAITTQSPLARGAKVLACRYSPAENRYELRMADAKGKGGTILAVDPTTLAPLESLRYEDFLPDLGSEASKRHSYRIVFNDLQGSGASTLPARARLWTSRREVPDTELKWVRVEVWPDVTNAAFDFKNAASFKVKEY